jgi:hypothetical protein
VFLKGRLGSGAIQEIGALTPAEGARTSIYPASSPQVRGVSGGTFVKCRPVRAAPRAYDEPLQRRLWEVSEQITSAA